MSEKRSPDHVGSSVLRAVAVLQQGGIVAFPTETYYGLAVDPDCDAAVARLFQIKQRPVHKPLLLLIDKSEQLDGLVSDIPQAYKGLMDEFWPGPLTLVFPASKNISLLVSGGTGTIAVRISPHPIARQLIQKMGKPITATSANLSGVSPAKTADQVLGMFHDKVDYILDGGETTAGLCSTVIGLQNGNLVVLRHGQVDVVVS